VRTGVNMNPTMIQFISCRVNYRHGFSLEFGLKVAPESFLWLAGSNL
jgi:hypothetical protein